MIIWLAKKKKFTKARGQDLVDGELEGDLKTSGPGVRGACNNHLGVMTLVRKGVTRREGHCKHIRV